MKFQWSPRVFSLAASSFVVLNQKDEKTIDEQKRRAKLIKKIVDRFLVTTGSPGATIAVSVNGRLEFAGGFGFADVENGTRCRPENVMRIASISKPITAAIAGQLVERGKLNWDDSIYKLLPDFPKKKFDGKEVNEISIRQLLNHTAGIRHYRKTAEDTDVKIKDQNYAEYGGGNKDLERLSRKPYKSIAEALQMFKDDDLAVQPGKFNYTTHGYTLLSACLEKAAGRSFDQMASDLFRRLEMRSTYLDKNEPLIPNRVKFYRRNRFHMLVNMIEIDNSYKIAGGGMLSNVFDLVKFANAMLISFQSDGNQNTLLKAETVDGMWLTKAVGPNYVLGWRRFLKEGTSREGMWFHTGANIGASSILMIKAKETEGAELPNGICVVILVNSQDGHNSITRLALDIIDIFEDDDRS
ncbi:hypothetical protein M3Y94_00735800 [Aphelenchoides besseyi]|nr:hypothetical protein M3Y94_00735800 [Aphelenchoides besseyi]